MGDISRDPIDHARTSRPRVGQTLKTPALAAGVGGAWLTREARRTRRLENYDTDHRDPAA